MEESESDSLKIDKESPKKTYDYLKVTSEKDIIKAINNEKVIFSDNLIKINRHNLSQERKIVITNLAIYNFKKKSKEILFM